MGKKGFSYVDVMISVGIFIIYTGFLLITLRPTIIEEYDEDYLINIIKEGFITNNYWTIERVPLFITGNQTQNNVNLKIPDQYLWEENEFMILDGSNQEINYDIVGDILEFGPIELTKWENYTFWLIKPKEQHTYESGIPSGLNILSDYKNYTYGVYEPITGISLEKLDTLNNTDYKDIKNQWNYPPNKEFYINLPDTNHEIGILPLENVDLHILKFHTNILHNNSLIQPTILTIKTW